jgi:hypothetical protein
MEDRRLHQVAWRSTTTATVSGASMKLILQAVGQATVAASLLWCAAATAHGPMPQRVTQSVIVEATPDVVWSRIGNFADAGWHPLVAATKADHGNDPGSVRVIELRDGGHIVESLQSRSDAERLLTYELVEPGPIPVSNYRATVTVKGGTGQSSVVEWSAGFMRADRSPRPEAGKTDAAAAAAVTDLMRVGLEAIQASVGRP